jgi:hypothetical protein
MANVQKQFETFNGNIRLGKFDENETLREKRNIVRRKVNERLPGVFEDHNEDCPKWNFYDQGSYDMDLGIKPLNDDFDIDQGLYFEVSTADYDPVILKKRVHEALDGHTDEVRIRKPCVTVFYHNQGERIYHVDIAVYSSASKNADGKSYLAVGRESTPKEKREWQISSPRSLKDKILSRFDGEDRKQFRRIVRYLKRWKDKNFSSDGNAAPLGIGLTVLVYDHLQATYFDAFAGKADDLGALRKLIPAILTRFETKFSLEKLFYRRVVVPLPVEPWNDLFEQMSDKQVEDFEEKLKKLRDTLNEAADAVDPVLACKKLQKVFGDDFPVPEATETAQKHSRAIVSSSVSA